MSMFADMTLQELNALAERQRRQIEEQEKSLQGKRKYQERTFRIDI